MTRLDQHGRLIPDQPTMSRMGQELVKSRIVYDIVDCYKKGDLPSALREAATYIEGLPLQSAVEHIIASNDDDRGWFATIVVMHVIREQQP